MLEKRGSNNSPNVARDLIQPQNKTLLTPEKPPQKILKTENNLQNPNRFSSQEKLTNGLVQIPKSKSYQACFCPDCDQNKSKDQRLII